jgi:hypothetical protein
MWKCCVGNDNGASEWLDFYQEHDLRAYRIEGLGVFPQELRVEMGTQKNIANQI